MKNVSKAITDMATLSNWTIIYQKGIMNFSGKDIPFEKLGETLKKAFKNMANEAITLPVKKKFIFHFDQDAPMGIRGEIESTVDDARQAALTAVMKSTDKPLIMLKSFYSMYMTTLMTTHKPMDLAELKPFLTTTLAKSLAIEKEPNSDYFTKTQDFADDWYEYMGVGGSETATNKAAFKVEMGADSLQTSVLVDLVKVGGSWKIDKVKANK